MTPNIFHEIDPEKLEYVPEERGETRRELFNRESINEVFSQAVFSLRYFIVLNMRVDIKCYVRW